MYYAYMVLIGGFCLVFALNLFQERGVLARASYAILLVPFLLRLLGLK